MDKSLTSKENGQAWLHFLVIPTLEGQIPRAAGKPA